MNHTSKSSRKFGRLHRHLNRTLNVVATIALLTGTVACAAEDDTDHPTDGPAAEDQSSHQEVMNESYCELSIRCFPGYEDQVKVALENTDYDYTALEFCEHGQQLLAEMECGAFYQALSVCTAEHLRDNCNDLEGFYSGSLACTAEGEALNRCLYKN